MRKSTSALAIVCGLFAPKLLATDVTSGAIPPLEKVVVVIFENADYDQAMASPVFEDLAKGGATLDNFHAETHPSQPNYIALTSGDLHGVHNDGIVNLDVPHLGDLLESAGKTWKVYAENYPGHCYLGARKGRYARKHVPFLSYRDVQNDPQRCARIVNATQFKKDYENAELPDFSLFIPNLDNDGHDTDADYAGKWLNSYFGPLLAQPNFARQVLLVATFDEGDKTPDNHIYTVLFGRNVKRGTTSTRLYDHYSLLRTLEIGFGLGSLGENDDTAAPLDDIWQ